MFDHTYAMVICRRRTLSLAKSSSCLSFHVCVSQTGFLHVWVLPCLGSTCLGVFDVWVLSCLGSSTSASHRRGSYTWTLASSPLLGRLSVEMSVTFPDSVDSHSAR